MKTINLAHFRVQGIDCAVFEADAHLSTRRDNVLQMLAAQARMQGLKVDKAALAFSKGGRIHFRGTQDLVRYLSRSGLPRWTHRITI